MRSLVYYVAASVDGFIADPSGDFSCFPTRPETLAELFARYPETCPTQARAALGVDGEPRRFDTVILGRRTHLPAMQAGLSGGAYPHLRQIVVTHDAALAAEGVEVMSGDVAAQVAILKQQPGQDIWLCGGGHLAAQLIDLVDELQIKVNPVVLGDGVPLVAGADAVLDLDLVTVEQIPGDVTLLTYRRRGA